MRRQGTQAARSVRPDFTKQMLKWTAANRAVLESGAAIRVAQRRVLLARNASQGATPPQRASLALIVAISVPLENGAM